MGLTDAEYQRILELMGRTPTMTELGMFSVMWSEHCSYKHSRLVLKAFAKYKEATEGDGLENAGVIDIGDGLGVVMKVESHNHPSAVEPYQGAATGVGGIIRDIFTMGARPIAMLNSLRFGTVSKGVEPEGVVRRNRYLLDRVVGGIGGYGNCVGVPTVAGEVAFHPRYSGNPLVNAMCVGLVKLSEVTTASAAGVGNPVVYLGSATGKDGIHGASFASDVLGEDSHANRPNVQIGDPFAEKQLIEATLEALQTGAIQSIQDMGAAGLTCSTIEMSSKGGIGMKIDLDKVPMREDDMTAYELMLSESQERMLCVCHAGREHEVVKVFHKWGVHAEVVGHITDDGMVSIYRHGQREAFVVAAHLTDECPAYPLNPLVPAYHEQAAKFDPSSLPSVEPEEALKRLLGWPDIADKTWITRQYDQEVQTQTTLKCGQGDAAVLAPRGTKKGLGVKIDGNGRQVYFDPYVGGQLVVAEACRNVACTGALPVAATDGLNFGNPEEPHVAWQFERSVQGIADACEALRTPVVSGNVSFYNQSQLGEVFPTPMVGILGVLSDARNRVGNAASPGESLVLLRYTHADPRQQGLGASAYLAAVHGIDDGLPVAPDLAAERALCEALVRLAEEGVVSAAHDVSEGGLAVCLAEMTACRGLGAEISLPTDAEKSRDGLLFGEWPGWVVVATSTPEQISKFLPSELSAVNLGRVTSGGKFKVSQNDQVFLAIDPSLASEWHKTCLQSAING
jgi:phosphoribosylformylglycinamidine synthase